MKNIAVYFDVSTASRGFFWWLTHDVPLGCPTTDSRECWSSYPATPLLRFLSLWRGIGGMPANEPEASLQEAARADGGDRGRWLLVAEAFDADEEEQGG